MLIPNLTKENKHEFLAQDKEERKNKLDCQQGHGEKIQKPLTAYSQHLLPTATITPKGAYPEYYQDITDNDNDEKKSTSYSTLGSSFIGCNNLCIEKPPEISLILDYNPPHEKYDDIRFYPCTYCTSLNLKCTGFPCIAGH